MEIPGLAALKADPVPSISAGEGIPIRSGVIARWASLGLPFPLDAIGVVLESFAHSAASGKS